MLEIIARCLARLGFACLLALAASFPPPAGAQEARAAPEPNVASDEGLAFVAIEGGYVAGEYPTWVHGGSGALTGGARLGVVPGWVYVSLDGLVEYVYIGDALRNFRLGVGAGLAFFDAKPLQLVVVGHVGLAFLGTGREGVALGIPLDVNAGIDLFPFRHLLLGLRVGGVWMPDLDKTRSWLRVVAVLGYGFF